MPKNKKIEEPKEKKLEELLKDPTYVNYNILVKLEDIKNVLLSIDGMMKFVINNSEENKEENKEKEQRVGTFK